jgi:hypothetical protein
MKLLQATNQQQQNKKNTKKERERERNRPMNQTRNVMNAGLHKILLLCCF